MSSNQPMGARRASGEPRSLSSPPHDAGAGAGCTIQHAFAVHVVAELRRRFALPIDQATFVLKALVAERERSFPWLVRTIAEQGVSVLLRTDGRSAVDILTDLELARAIEAGLFASDDAECSLLLKLNPLVNKALELLDPPVRFANHGAGYAEQAHVQNEMTVRSAREYAVLRTVRQAALNGANGARVEISFKDSDVGEIQVHEGFEVTPEQADALSVLGPGPGFGSIVLGYARGKVRSIQTNRTIKPDRET